MLVFEPVEAQVENREISLNVIRARVPGGWLVQMIYDGIASASLSFVPDPEHKWNPADEGKSGAAQGPQGLHTHVAIT